MRMLRLLALVSLAASAVSAVAAPNLLANGSFESPAAPFPYANYVPGAATVTGWTVVETNAAWNTSHGWDHYVSIVPAGTFASYGVSTPYGGQYADLTGVFGQGKGLLSDGVDTTVGATYRLTFALGEFWVRGQGSYGEAAVNVLVNGTDQGLFRNLVTLSSPGTDWQTMSLDFVATQASTRVQITNAIGTGYSNAGTGLDDVRLEYLSAPVISSPIPAVPEPQTYALMLGGLGLLAAARARRGR